MPFFEIKLLKKMKFAAPDFYNMHYTVHIFFKSHGIHPKESGTHQLLLARMRCKYAMTIFFIIIMIMIIYKNYYSF